MTFVYEAMNASGRLIRDRVDADDHSSAFESLRDRGLLVVKLNAAPADAEARAAGTRPWSNRGPGLRDLMLFARQMKMMLESGSALVPALTAVEQQTGKPLFRRAIRTAREHVESGQSLHEALAKSGNIFSPIFCNMVAAGEATGALPEAFDRLADLIHQQAHVRRAVVGAMVYPAVLAVLLVGVLGVLMGFVIPRFAKLFDSLNHELPWMTRILIDTAVVLRTHWLIVGAALIGLIAAVAMLVARPAWRALIGDLLLRLPVFGRLLIRLQLARILRVWAAQLRSHVPLLETISRSRDVASLRPFRKLIDDIEVLVSSGGHMGRALAASPLIDPVLASAVTTGEENGRLAEAIDFISAWLDEENNQAVANLTRTLEPVMLAFMGLVVGFVAMALFIPLFDVATAAG